MFVNNGSLRFAEADEIDEIGEDLDQPVVGRFRQVGESKVIDTALVAIRIRYATVSQSLGSSGAKYLCQKFPDIHKEAHQVSCVIGYDVGVVATYIFCRYVHSRLNRFARSVHQKFCKPFEDHLDLLGIGFGEVGGTERNPNVVDTSCNFLVGLL